MPDAPPKLVACPSCGKLTPYASRNKWRPFCSERCKLIDLGHWAAERYRVPDPSAVQDEPDPRED